MHYEKQPLVFKVMTSERQALEELQRREHYATISETIRQALRQALRDHGLWPPKNDCLEY